MGGWGRGTCHVELVLHLCEDVHVAVLGWGWGWVGHVLDGDGIGDLLVGERGGFSVDNKCGEDAWRWEM